MRVRRLGWAGVELEHEGERAVIDLFGDVGGMRRFVGEPRGELPAPAGPVALALVTHLHGDHTDPAAVARVLTPSGVVGRPQPATGSRLETAGTAEAEASLSDLGLATRVLSPWESIEAGPFRATAVPAVDGFGDPQVSWVVEAGGMRILHAGDTLFHGSWWLIPMRLGPIDIALLPINGPLVDLPHRQPPSPLAAAMDPFQAAAAAKIVGARLAVPIHYDALHHPPTYMQVDDPAGRFVQAATELGVDVAVVEPGAMVSVVSSGAGIGG